MVPYIIHVSLLITLSYLLYRFLWEKETFFDLHRWILLLGLVLSFVLPLLVIPSDWSIHSAAQNVMNTNQYEGDAKVFEPENKEPSTSVITHKEGDSLTRMEVTFQKEKENQAIEIDYFSALKNQSIATYLRYIYLAGVLIFSINFLIQLLLILFQRATNPIVKDGRYRIVEINQDKAPFSFGQNIFINPSKYDWETYSHILAHEKIHVRQGHTLDILIAELMVIVQWFNPFAWGYRKIVENNLEYQTDQLMLHQGTKKDIYQMNLLRISVPQLPLNLTTNYNQSFLKKRIVMMNCKKSSASSSWKYLIVLPLLGLTIVTLNPIQLQSQASSTTTTPKEETIPAPVVAPVEVVTPPPAPSPEVAPAIRVDSPSKTKTVTTTTSTTTIVGDWDMPPNYEEFDHEDDIHIIGSTSFDENNITLLKGMITVNGEELFLDHTGSWTAELETNEICIQFMHNSKKGSYSIFQNRCLAYQEFSPNPKTTSKGPFQIKRAAGILELRGVFENREGFGKYSFTQDDSFVAYLKSKGITATKKYLLFHLFMADIDQQYIAYLEQQGYTNLSEENLKDIAIHGLSKDRIKEYLEGLTRMGYEKPSLKALKKLAIHDVSIEYIENLGRELFEDLTMDQIAKAAIHDIDPEFIREMKSIGYEGLSFNEVVEFSIHDININFVKELRAAGLDLTKDQIVEAAIHNIDPDYIKEIKNLGYDNLSFRDIVEFGIHGIDANYISDLKKAGLNNLSQDQIVEAAIHNISPRFIKEVQSLDLGNLDFKQIVKFKIHNITPRYIQALKDTGLKNLTQRNIVKASIHGITPSFIKRVNESGAFEENMSIEDYIKLKIHGVDKKLRQR